ncbi:MAG: thioredoxin domain-containing protein [Actinobacteria bacterium]|nr:thioredoxin domain-containing protein [Actinomycetota bacterium]MBV8479374.1 thioredoxin domain-containing protein [Actinomycetota bacterium]
MNRLAHETSPYLLQHAGNPVDWYPWGDEAFARARVEDKPVLLSVGYAACHWCHVMEDESFEDEETARLMNELFVSVKVDREERPDVDALYMDAVVSLTGQGGWPMTVFLTPEGAPFFGGTYYPPEPRHGLPSFRQLLVAIGEAYRDRKGDVTEQAQTTVDALRQGAARTPSREPLDRGLVSEAVRTLRRQFDPEWGGFGHAPKFPPASAIELLLRTGDLDMATVTLDGMASGGMWDVVGGGFHRYSVDEEWLVPHFEKMLYDNALLASTYLHAWIVVGTDRYREVAERTLDYMVRELRLPSGGFASSQDADTDGVEGLTYTWTEDEGVPPDALRPFEHGRSIIRGELDDETRARLLGVRAERLQPALDDKVIASWNGLALAALAEGARRLRRDDLLGAARTLGELLDVEPLWRTLRSGRTKFPAYLDDYANVSHGLIELHLATGELRWLLAARRTALRAVELFSDPASGGFFLTPTGGEQLVARRKELEDTPTPSGNAMLANVLLRLARIWGDDDLERLAAGVLRLVRDVMPRAPAAFGWALCTLDLYLAPPRELAIVGAVESEVAQAALRGFNPESVAAVGPSDDVPLLEGKTLVDGLPAVYVCERFACRAPVTDPGAFADS